MVPELRVRLLGGLVVEGLGERELGSRKGRTVLKALALGRGRPVSIDRLAEIVWGDDQPARPAEQIGVLVSRLRGVVGQDRLTRSDAGYVLLVDWLDLDELAARVDQAGGALKDGRLAAARSAADAAIALARGDLLPEEEGGWVEAQRPLVATLVAAAHRIAAEAALRSGDANAAGALGERSLAHDPCDEASLRVLMRAHVVAGRPASALSAYVRLRERLVEDLGVSPMPETEELHDAIVLGRLDAGPASVRPPRQVKIAGRAAELAAIEAAFERVAATGSSGTVVVEGEAGIGKTTLVQAWTETLEVDVLLLRGRCDELGRDLALQPVADAVAGHLGGLSPDDRHRLVGDLHLVAPLLGMDIHDAGLDTTSVLDAEAGRATLFAALSAVVSRLAAGRPIVLTIDDVHLAADSTLSWLAFAVRRIPSLLVIETTRRLERPVLDADVVMSLDPLEVDELAELVGWEQAVELHARTGGQPLLVSAVLANLDEALPASLAEAVERRVAGLGPAAATLRTAAILGSQIDLDLLAEVMNAPAIELLAHLEAAATGGLVVEEDGFRFRHELERAVLDASVGSTRRALAHRQAARALAIRPEVDPLTVARHARLGGELSLAIDWYVVAARMSMARFDLRGAEDHLGAALAMGDSIDALVARARVRIGMGRLEEAADDAAAAVALGGDTRALEVAGWVAYYRRRYEEARACADEALERATTPALRVSCLALAGRVLHASGDLPRAVEQLEQAMALPAPSEVKGLAAVWLAQARVHQGRPAESLAVVSRALVDPGRLLHPFAPLYGHFARVLALGQLGRVGDALAACDEMDGAVARTGAAGERFAAASANCRAWILRWTGCGDQADELNSAVVASGSGEGLRAETYYAALLDLVDGRLLAGDLDGAGTLLERLNPIAEWSGTMAWHQRHRWDLSLARLTLAIGDPAGAAERAAGVEADAGARGARRYALLASALRALAEGPSADVAALGSVVRGLGECAALDGWPTVAALAEAFGVDEWRTEACRRAEAVVGSAPDRDAAGALARRIIG